MDKKVTGLKIKDLRSKKGFELGYKYTGEMLANDLGISRSYLGDIESGRRLPSPELIKKIIDIFNVSEDYFYSNDNKCNNEYELDKDVLEIAKELNNLSNDKKDILKKLIKTMGESDKEI